VNGDLTINLTDLSRLSAMVPALFSAIERLEQKLSVERSRTTEVSPDCWLDAEQARKYMGNLSKGTFDKYRYQTNPRLKGYKLDGKTLFKKSDLDNFIRLYELKSSGLA
jgi:hypothetical protein